MKANKIPLLWEGKPYTAHSELIDEKRNKRITPQKYETHVKGVYDGVEISLNRIKKYINPKKYAVMEKALKLAAIYHDLGKLDDQAQKCLYGEIKTQRRKNDRLFKDEKN